MKTRGKLFAFLSCLVLGLAAGDVLFAAAPTASFISQPASYGRPPLTITFNATASSDPEGGALVYDWEFGDGATLSNGGPTPVHTYVQSGTFVPKLTVTDIEASTDTTLRTVLCFSSVTLQIGAGASVAGNDVFLPVTYSSSAEIGTRGLTFTVSASTSVTFVDAITTVPGWQLFPNPANGNVLMISMNASDLPAGVIATLQMRAEAGAAVGNYAVTFSTADPTQSGGAIHIPAQILFGTVTIQPGLAPPEFTSSGTAQGTALKAFSYPAAADNSPTSFSALGLPPGLSINTNTGLISGTPNTQGTFNVTLTAANGAGATPFPLQLTINPPEPPALAVGTTAGPDGTYVIVPIYFIPGSTPVVDMQFDLAFATHVIIIDVSTGAAAPLGTTAAQVPGQQRVTILGDTPIGEGVIALVRMYIYAGTAPGTETMGMSVPTFLDANNQTVTGRSSNGTIEVQATPTPAPTITSPGSAPASTAAPFVYKIIATDDPISFNATGLPAGLAIHRASGYISGTPQSAGAFNVTLAATNVTGTGNKSLTINVSAGGAAAPPVVTSPNSLTVVILSTVNFQITATNNPFWYTVTGLPEGLGLEVDNITGLITGTASLFGTVQTTVTAVNSYGGGSQIFTFTSNPPPPSVITSTGVDQAFLLSPYTYQITATPGPQISYDAIGLPPGLSLNTSSGLISGAPTSTGTFNIDLSATNLGGTGNKTLVLTVAVPPPPVITSTGTAQGAVGTAFTYSIVATNGPISYSAAGLPAGLSINTNSGVISGVPVSSGTFNITLGATNGGGTGNKTLVLTVTLQPSPSITSDGTAQGVVGSAFAYQIVATNSPTSYSAAGLAPGLSVDTAGGLISGTPTSSGTFVVTLGATNVGGTGNKTLTLTITQTSVVRAYPNPWRADKNTGPVHFSHIDAGSQIHIFAEDGHAVRSFTAAAPASGWDLTDDGGRSVSSGLYFFLIIDSQGRQSKGKLFIAK